MRCPRQCSGSWAQLPRPAASSDRPLLHTVASRGRRTDGRFSAPFPHPPFAKHKNRARNESETVSREHRFRCFALKNLTSNASRRITKILSPNVTKQIKGIAASATLCWKTIARWKYGRSSRRKMSKGRRIPSFFPSLDGEFGVTRRIAAAPRARTRSARRECLRSA